MSTSQAEIEADIARTRAQLKEAVDELSERLSPSNQVAHLTEETKLAVTDLKRRVTGEVRPTGEPEPTRAGWIVLGAGAALVVTVLTKIIRKL